MFQSDKEEHIQTLKDKNKGATLFTALVVTSMILAIGASISTVAFKSARLSSIGRDSQAAYYAAEGGLECGMYWHRIERAFDPEELDININCNGLPVVVSKLSPCVVGDCTFSFSLDFPNVSYCAEVKVITSGGSTTIESRGYNTCSGGRRVERRLRYST
jgi:hypothetical protein